MHAFEVSFDRPFDHQVFHNMVTELELPWVRFLERNGIDVALSTNLMFGSNSGEWRMRYTGGPRSAI